MATHVFKNPYLSIDGVNLTQYIREVALSYSADAVEDTSPTSDGTRTHMGGLKDWAVSATLKQDYAANGVDQTLFSLVGSSTVAIVLKPTTAAPSGTNPRYHGTGMLQEYPPMGAAIGDLHTSEISVVAAGTLNRSTST